MSAPAPAGVVTVFWQQLQTLRKRRGLTLAQLADRTGLKPPVLCRYENAQALPSIDSLRKLADGLGCSADELLGRQCTPAAPPGFDGLLALNESDYDLIVKIAERMRGDDGSE